ncbi:uncharacterized protein LOC131631843 isoform X3 [Vicia villosa]|uniref:uncharacterized protein LOC131631843 isoform X3 n=1 Tax=Vicia villosa TaxID=3911 RepID=UPI00273B640C|nr:uncharacterized protein LOC131631843 isoform X3 [Vicia villosa]
MPGTILVSVLEFMDLPFSSSTPIRASMGKIEYQISDKGNFSFPIASLRDDLIFKIHDFEGNEISRAGVHIRMILEKGVWEDTFPLGEGYLHLKLQVVLSDEERDKIRMMRQTALKKKQDVLLNSNAALPFRTSDERLFPDVLSAPSSQESSPNQYLQHEKVSQLQSPVDFSNDKESSTTNVAEAEVELDQKQLNSNIADQYNKTSSIKPVSQEINLIPLENGGNKPANQPPSENHPQRATSSQEMVIFLSSEKVSSSTNNPIQDNLEDAVLPNSEKKARLGRTPSNVKKMISAFESGLPKDMKSHIKPPPTKFQVMSPMEKKDPSETRHFEQDKSLNIDPIGLQEKSKSASLVRDLQEVPEHIEESREQIHIPNRQIDSNARNEDQQEEQIHIPNRQIDSNSYIKTEIDGSKYEKIQDIKESKINTFDDNEDENSGGPFNQVIKVAIIMGFGLLVLLTRQRNKRRKDKNT